MAQIVVFDTGWGGEMVADFLEKELPVMEIIRVIDWRHAPYYNKSNREIRRLAENALDPYIGVADVILLASNVLSVVTLKYLRKRYPGQKFVGISWPIIRKKKRILILTTKKVEKSWEFYKDSRRWKDAKMEIFECDDWVCKIDDGVMDIEEIRDDLAKYLDFDPDVMVIGCTHLLDARPVLEEMFGYGTWVADGNKRTLKNLCRVLKLKGSVAY